MPPRRQTRRTTGRANRLNTDSASNETPVDPNIVTAINQDLAGLLPNLVAQKVEAVIQKTRSEGHANQNTNSGARFQKQKRISFSHATTPIKARNWIAHIEKIYEVLGVEDQYKVRLAAYKLEDDVQAWWEGHKQAKGGDAYAATLPWVDFRRIFYEKYLSTADSEAYVREYAVIRQGNDEPASEFIVRFARLASIVGDAAGTPKIQAEKCKWAVCDRIRKSIMFMKFKDLTEVAYTIKTFEF
ncbi:uncharacterized protein LOC143542935 [Bidens hawaiensis]|uniref:uncharacterized protein LOC143542935 n=1 Tax=Bidens hawaiensis TaxID=980011 RepID=UPI00404AF0A5